MAHGHVLPVTKLSLQSEAGVAVWLVGPVDPGGVPQHLWNTLSSGEKERANRFHRAQDQALFASTRAMLRHLLGETTGVLPQNIAFTEGFYGKPCLAGAGGPHFNVSHSGTFALIGISATRPIGVDIEAIRAKGGELDLARHFFSDAEYRALERLEGDVLLSSFYKIWTCKEAILKASGRGISQHLKDFSVELTKDGYKLHLEPFCLFLPEIASVTAEPVEVPEGYVACYALA
jgi:4'-phosphopantetheinyl transferase